MFIQDRARPCESPMLRKHKHRQLLLQKHAIIEQLIADFTMAGITACEVEYMEARWKKEVWNMPFNGMTVVLDTRTDHLLANPETRELIHRQMLGLLVQRKQSVPKT